MRRKLPAVVVVLVAALAAGAWWFDLPQRTGWGRAQQTSLTLYGNVDIRQVRLGFRVGGRIVGMAMEEGDRVEPGALLARLDAQPYQDAMRAAEAQVARRAAILAKLKAGPRAAEIAQARALLAERVAELENARRVFERARRLRADSATSQASLDQAQAAKDMAAARLSSARAALRLLEEGTRAEDIAAAQAGLRVAQANLSAARTSLRDTRLFAPSAGVILSRVREPGAIVSPGDTVYVLSLGDPVWVRAYIAEPDLGRIYPGMAVEVVTDTAPDRPYRGQVGFISPVAEFTPKSVQTPELRTSLVYRLRIVVNDADKALRQGMPVTVHVPLSAGEPGGGM